MSKFHPIKTVSLMTACITWVAACSYASERGVSMFASEPEFLKKKRFRIKNRKKGLAYERALEKYVACLCKGRQIIGVELNR